MSEDMDAAAEIAKKELVEMAPEAVRLVGKWMAKHFASAGYKRLSRALMSEADRIALKS